MFTLKEQLTLHEAIKTKYAAVAKSAEGLFRYKTGRAGAISLGYDEVMIADIPSELMNAFCGVGNPFCIEPIKTGSSLLDIGCGAGFDLIVASRTVGSAGRVCGIDITPEMLQRARENFTELGITDIEVLQADAEKIPYENSTFDVVISSGVINLSTSKNTLFMEIFRVLKPGGQLQFADIVLEKEVPSRLAAGVDSWAQ